MNSELRARIRADLRTAIAERDAVRASVLRTTLAALDNAEAVDAATVSGGVSEVSRHELGEAEVRRVLADEHAEAMDAAALLDRFGRRAEAAELRRKAQELLHYLDLAS